MLIRSRYRQILWFFGKVLISLLFWDVFLPKIGLRGVAERTRPDRLKKIASSYRELAIQLGGVLIKVGQWLSTRLDVLPQEITNELADLQDEVKAEDFADIRTVIEAEFGEPVESRFAWVDPVALAAASIGQVHRAQLKGSAEILAQDVVIKVQRPNIEAIVHTDLSAIQVVSRWIQLYRPLGKRVNVPALVNEFSASLLEEIDYLHEGKNAETFAANFANDPHVQVPQVFWAHTTRRVLTLEEIHAIKINHYAEIEAAGISRTEVANRMFDVYLKQIFEDHFFHADPHPGNLFVAPLDANPDDPDGPRPWKLVFIDFGMVGEVTDNVVAGLRELVIAVAQRDPERTIKAYQLMGVLLPTADLELLKQANQRAFERFWGKTAPELMQLSQTEAMAFVSEFRDLLLTAPFQLPENMLLLGRCLTILSGICSGLDEAFNVWQSVMPWARKLVDAEGGKAFDAFFSQAGEFVRVLTNIPRRTEALLTRLEQGRLDVRSPELRLELMRANRNLRRITTALIFMTFTLGGVQLYLANAFWPALLFTAGALIALVGLVFTRSG
jgi:predicted unusual protein kinase regulating ubiquinone biosynthesis (AarF/ABC1/UbiB family)